MAGNRIVIKHAYDDPLFEWPALNETDTDPDFVSFPPFAEMTVQLMAMTGTGTVIVEYSLSTTEDVSKVWAVATDSVQAPIALTVAGQGSFVNESGILMRPRVSAGTGVVARVRIKFTFTRG